MERIRRKRDLDKVFTEGRRLYSPWVALRVRQRQPAESVWSGLRVAAVASRGFGSAVARNRAKRLLRETCRIVLGECREPWDIVLIARAGVLSVPFAQRVQVLSTLLREAGVLGEKAAAAV